MPLGPQGLQPHSSPLSSGTSLGAVGGTSVPKKPGTPAQSSVWSPPTVGLRPALSASQEGPQYSHLPGSFFPQLPHPASWPPALQSPRPEQARRQDHTRTVLSPELPNHTQPGSQRCHFVSNAQGHFCQPGAARPAPCHRGEYQPSLGSDTCLLCPPGFYCPHAGTGVPRLCPAHAYCPAGMPRILNPPCLPGPLLSPQHPHLPLIHSFIPSFKIHGVPTVCRALCWHEDHQRRRAHSQPSSSTRLYHPNPCCFSSLRLLTGPCSMPCLSPPLHLGAQGEYLDQRGQQTGVIACANSLGHDRGVPPEHSGEKAMS